MCMPHLCLSRSSVCTSSIRGVTHLSSGTSSLPTAGRSPDEGQSKTPAAPLYAPSAFQCSHLLAKGMKALRLSGESAPVTRRCQLAFPHWQHLNAHLDTWPFYTQRLPSHVLRHFRVSAKKKRKKSWRLSNSIAPLIRAPVINVGGWRSQSRAEND